MTQSKPAAAGAPNSAEAPPAKKGSVLRLSILLGVLVILLVALGYDYAIAKPAMEDANKRLQALVDERHKQGVEKGQPVFSADVQKVIGFAPTITKKNDDKTTVEMYCWWGPMPYLNTARRYLWVKYEGNEPQHVSTFDYESDPNDPGTTPPADGPDANAPLPMPGTGMQGHGPARGDNKPAEEKPATEKPTDQSPAAPTGGTNG